jgi:hypothetical protein
MPSWRIPATADGSNFQRWLDNRFAAFIDLATPEDLELILKSVLEYKEPGDKGHSSETKKILRSDLGNGTDGSVKVTFIAASRNVAEFTNKRKLLNPPPSPRNRVR